MNKQNQIKLSDLTDRQIECAKLLIQGKTAREIAVLLGLSRRTVEYYVNNLKTKLECKNKVELVLTISNLLNNHFNTNKND